MRRNGIGIGIVLLLMSSVAAPVRAGQEQPVVEEKSDTPEAPVRVLWRDRPSIRLGDVARIDLRVKLHDDLRMFEPNINTDEDTHSFSRARIGVQGHVFGHIEYQVERELRDTDNPWRDVFVNVSFIEDAQVQAGKFKVPFGLEQLTGVTDLDFIYRSLASNNLTPGRDRGVMVHGRIWRRGLTYEGGVFRKDGENARFDDPFFVEGEDPGAAAGHSVAARVTGTPLRRAGATLLEDFRVGFGFTRSKVPDGLNSLQGRTVFGYPFFPRIYVQGRRLRLGAEAAWEPGPASIKWELIRVADARDEQSLRSTDLSDFISQGWYLSGTWILTGEKKAGSVNPRRELFRGGSGAIEVGARFERLGFGSKEHPGVPFRNPRAENILENRDEVWTFGLTWYPNRWVKIQGNAIHDEFVDMLRTPNSDTRRYWAGVFRFQMVM